MSTQIVLSILFGVVSTSLAFSFARGETPLQFLARCAFVAAVNLGGYMLYLRWRGRR